MAPSWAGPELTGTWDYAQKAWSGLVGGFYAARYRLFALHKVRGNFSHFDVKAYQEDIMQLADTFQRERWDENNYPAVPAANAVAVSRELWLKYTV